MNKTVLGIAIALIAVAMLANPVLAIGPQNAVNNPNVDFSSYGVALESPSGMKQEWVNVIDKHLMYMDAREFKINNAFVVTAISQVSENENKWLFFSVPMFAAWMVSIYPNMPYKVAYGWVLGHYPEGVYYREVFVGK